MKSILNIFKGKDGKEKSDKKRVQFDRKIQVCKNSTPIKQQKQTQKQKKSTLLFRDDMFIGKTAGYDTPARPRTRKPLESCPGNIASAAAAAPININSSPSTNSEIVEEENDENIDRQTSFSSENEIDYFARYKHYKKLSRILSHQNNNLQLRLYQYENQPSSSSMNFPDSDELQRLRIENSELRSRYNQLTVDIERSLSYQKPPAYYHPPPSHHHLDIHRQNLLLYSHHHHQTQQQLQHGYPTFNPQLYPPQTTANFSQYSNPLLDIPRNFSANGQYDPSETDNTDQGEHDKNIFGNSIPKVAAVTTHPSTPSKSTNSDEIC